ncbi:endolytic transglycosylase MltG [Gallaecimonas sp. GXIMD4217]|uniref:endolytic transglycosylase MltG n=1 Tax=Gallaecimonas sp. GXIMD4217 TaxID=3131927 RepID=UPI00311B390C
MKKWLAAFGLLLTLATAALVAGALWVKQQWSRPLALAEPELLEVRAGDSAFNLLYAFHERGWLAEPRLGQLLLKLKPELGQIRAGCYEISPGMTLEAVLARLGSGDEASFAVTLIEGHRFQEWRQVLAEAPHLQLTLDNVSDAELAERLGVEHVEGWFMPETYHYRCRDKDSQVLARAHQAMKQALDELWPKRADDLPLASPYEALILASIVEKETAVAEERPLVAAVFVNRLRKKMRLQTDPTVIYGLGDEFDGNLTRQHLRSHTDYNTYVIRGLPPTPIAMPSRAAIEAVLHPAKTDYLYFVANGDGSHVFSRTLAEHNRAVNKYQRKR